MRHPSYLPRLFWLLMTVFAVGRIGFMLYNADFWPSPADPAVAATASPRCIIDLIATCLRGALTHDLVVSTLLLLPFAAASYSGISRLRKWLWPYTIVMATALGVIIVADIIMYEFWQFKLSAVVFSYAAYPEGAANSVSPAFVAIRLGAVLLFIALIAASVIALTPRRHEPRRSWREASITLFAFVLLFTGISTGSPYRSERIFLNHAAANPVYSFVASFSLRPYTARYEAFDEPRRAALMEGLYDGNGAGATDALPVDSAHPQLLRTDRPDVLIVFLESFGSEFVTSLGGARGTTPDGREADVDEQLERLIPEGIFWTNYYSNSFRTDRGTVSAYCGWPAYTDLGLMTHPEYHAALPSLPKSMRRAGYDTSYLYPGAMTNMGKGAFLAAIGFEHLLDDTFFTPDELDSSWGASDMTSARKTALTLAQPAAKPRLFCYQTVSSHEPWDVDYHRLTDKVQNAFAYTDAALGALIDSLKASPAWDNLLVVVIPDHGHLYKVPARSDAPAAKVSAQSTRLRRQAFDDPEFFHSPMLWLGGAIKEPCRMDVLMNQSDLCATLLGQLGLDHSDYPWSRDVLSPAYRYPFVYSVFPAGILFRDASGTTLYDTEAQRPIMQHDSDSAPCYGVAARPSRHGQERLDRARAILQTTYDGL